MDPNFVIELLKKELEARESSLEHHTNRIDALRNKLTTSVNKKDYIWLKRDLDWYEVQRRDLRGEISALRQAIKKLEKE